MTEKFAQPLLACPFCNSPRWEEFETKFYEGGVVEQYVRCDECEEVWVEIIFLNHEEW